MTTKPETVSAHKAPENGKPATPPPATPPPPVAAAPKAPKPNRQILKHQRALHKLEMASTARTLEHIAEATVCTSDLGYRGLLTDFAIKVSEFRARLDADLAKAEGA